MRVPLVLGSDLVAATLEPDFECLDVLIRSDKP